MKTTRKPFKPKFYLVDILSKKEFDIFIKELNIKNIKRDSSNKLILTKYFFEKELFKLKKILSEKQFLLFINSIESMDCIIEL